MYLEQFMNPEWRLSETSSDVLAVVESFTAVVALGISSVAIWIIRKERQRVFDLTTLGELVQLTNRAQKESREDVWWSGHGYLQTLSPHVSKDLDWAHAYFKPHADDLEERLDAIEPVEWEPQDDMRLLYRVVRKDVNERGAVINRSVQSVIFEELIAAISKLKSASVLKGY